MASHNFPVHGISRKRILAITIGEINENWLHSYDFIATIKLVDPVSSDLNKYALNHLKTFMFRLFQNDSYNNSLGASNLDLISVNQNSIPECDFIMNRHHLTNSHETIAFSKISEEEAQLLNISTGEFFNFKYSNRIKVLSNHVFTWTNNKIQIFDLNFNELATVIIPESPLSVVECTNDIVLIQASKIFMFNVNTFSIIGFINDPVSLISVTNRNIILNDGLKSSIFHFNYKINVDKKVFVDSKYICKMNPFKLHLYREPYYLPCGNSSCLECIYKSFNLYRRTIRCRFDTCEEEHYLSPKLEIGLTFNDTIVKNIGEIFINMLIRGTQWIFLRGLQFSESSSHILNFYYFCFSNRSPFQLI